MAYNSYGPPPGAYGSRQPSYPGYPPSGAPGLGPLPNMGAAPGMQAAPGMAPAQSPTAMQNPQFQLPPNMPNIDFSAPVIRMGVQDPQPRPNPMGGDRSGRGSNSEPLGRRDRTGGGPGDSRNIDRERAAVRESMMALQPPTREEVARTIFIGGLGEGAPDDDALESILRCAGKLRRWTRARDADDKLCKFGFAEYEDVDSLEAANEIYVDLELPFVNKAGMVERDEDGEVKKTKLLVVVDEQSKNYIDEWKGRRKEEDDARQFRLDGCKEDLRQALTALTNARSVAANAEVGAGADGDGNAQMGDGNAGLNRDGAEVVTIPLTLEDELADIPQEMRATVAEEIKAFRDRSNRRDIERLRREEEMELAEKQRSGAPLRTSRLASPPPSTAPSGPASASNGIPVGPRDRTVQGAPLGPRGYRGAQMPSDYVNGVTFVGANGISINREDDDAEESDEELERRRQAKKDAEAENVYNEIERRVLTREKHRGAAQEREKTRQDAENREKEREKEIIAKRFREWNDDEQARLGREEYYYDRSSWLRNRIVYRDQEQRADDRDRAAEVREKAEERKKTAEARGLADDFLDQTSNELAQKAVDQPSAGPAFVKMSLGSAAAKTRPATQQAGRPRAAMAEVEGLLEDEEDAAAAGVKRPELKPLTDTSTIPSASDMTDEQLREVKQQIAADIPTSTADLFAYPVKFNYLTATIVDQQIRPFVEKKIVDYLGVQEDLLVDTVMDGVKDKRGASAIVTELEDALEDEAETLMRKVWRMLVFCTECESRGLS